MPSTSQPKHRRQIFTTPCLLLVNLLVFQIAFYQGKQSVPSAPSTISAAPRTILERHEQVIPVNINDSLSIPIGKAVALPSVRVGNDTKRDDNYGGQGDKLHLGGWTEIDIHGLSPSMWGYMLETLGVKSVLDVGCGRGISTSWFLYHGVDALCVEGSHDAYQHSMLPDPSTQMVEHDFSRGPWWPSRTFDAIWCVEFLEHVGRNFHKNYLPAFRKAGLIFATHSKWGGWHHVEVHEDEWWILKFELYGFKYSEKLTNIVRDMAKKDKHIPTNIRGKDETYNSQHIWLHMMVFINPAVASLPGHAHLMAEMGCYKDKRLEQGQRVIVHRECGTGRNGGHESKMPDEFKPIRIAQPDKQHIEWEEWVRKNTNLGKIG